SEQFKLAPVVPDRMREQHAVAQDAQSVQSLRLPEFAGALMTVKADVEFVGELGERHDQLVADILTVAIRRPGGYPSVSRAVPAVKHVASSPDSGFDVGQDTGRALPRRVGALHGGSGEHCA